MRPSVTDLAAVAALSWRAPTQERHGNWLLRAADGFTGRANSALALGPPTVPVAEMTEWVQRWYAQRGLPAMIAIPYALGGPQSDPVDRHLDARGWTIRSGAATVMTASPDAAADADPRVGIDPEPDQQWLGMYHYRGQRLPPVARQLLTSAPWQAFASVREAGQVVAIGRVAVAAGWAGFTAVEVHRDHRRRGLATAITRTLTAAATARHVTGLYLQVEDGNTAARALYRQFGFSDHHGYHYRVAPGHNA